MIILRLSESRLEIHTQNKWHSWKEIKVRIRDDDDDDDKRIQIEKKKIKFEEQNA